MKIVNNPSSKRSFTVNKIVFALRMDRGQLGVLPSAKVYGFKISETNTAAVERLEFQDLISVIVLTYVFPPN
jgi:hypothetical protein